MASREHVTTASAPDSEDPWRDVEGDMHNIRVDSYTIEDASILNATRLMERSWMSINITLCCTASMLLYSGLNMSYNEAESLPQISIFCILWFGHATTLTLVLIIFLW